MKPWRDESGRMHLLVPTESKMQNAKCKNVRQGSGLAVKFPTSYMSLLFSTELTIIRTRIIIIIIIPYFSLHSTFQEYLPDYLTLT